MINSVLATAASVDGIIIGTMTGLVHETFVIVRKKSRIATISSYVASVLTSGFIGWITYTSLYEYEVPSGFSVFLTVVASLNSFAFIQVLSNLKLVIGVIGVLFPSMKDKMSQILTLLNSKNGNDS